MNLFSILSITHFSYIHHGKFGLEATINILQMTILHVDDDADDHDFFCIAVRKIDPEINCLNALDGDHALSILKNKSLELPQLIVLDINMPKMDGRNCLIEIRRDKRFDHIPVVMLSTLDQNNTVEEYKKLGAKDFIAKPNTIAKLKEELRRVLND